MRLPLLTVLLLSFPAVSQSWAIPTNTPASGNCNVIPFGSTSLGTWSDQKYQTIARSADLGSLPGVITGLGFAPCGSGSIHFDSLEVVLDHIPPAASLSSTFANNLSASAVTVLSVTDYTWNITADTWNEIGLQHPFVYNGTDDLVVQISQQGGITTGTAAFHRDSRIRLYATGSTGGTAAVSGFLSNAALKWEVSMMMARLSTYGTGCAGSNGTPLHSLGGTGQLGTLLDLDLSNGPSSGAAFAVAGFTNGFPYPVDLSGYGLTGCFQYIDALAIASTVTDPAGSATVPLGIPASTSFAGVLLYSQYACLDPNANAAGATTSGYGRTLIGN